MRVLVVNSGSATLKLDLIEICYAPLEGLTAHRLEHNITPWQVDTTPQRATVSQAIRQFLSTRVGQDSGRESKVDVVGHRIVAGGRRFVEPALLDDNTTRDLQALADLAPLHNPAALQGIEAAKDTLGLDVPSVAVFDTAFHSTIPDIAATYAIPHDLVERHEIRRYGYHGIAHHSMLRRYSQLSGVPERDATIITFQLGSGCSAAAIRNGRSVDTSMGFTPMEGLVMGTRSGDVDPGLLEYLAREDGMDIERVNEMLNRQSGLLGISGLSADMRDVLEASARDARAALAVEVFCYRAKKYLGSYLAALGGAQAVVFGGGIGEHAPAVRARICNEMEWCGLRLDAGLNDVTTEGRISASDSSIQVYIVPVDEAALIARQAAECVLMSNGEPLSKVRCDTRAHDRGTNLQQPIAIA
ncbi:MAG: acetate/propionate family kinase [Chloroflexi bacterium]|nr:acetate/propionate family kinase [Chloroflexota bacterium]